MLGASDLIGSREPYCYISLTSQDFGLAKCKLAWYYGSVGEVTASAHPKFTPYRLCHAKQKIHVAPWLSLLKKAGSAGSLLPKSLSWPALAMRYKMYSTP